MAKFYFCGLAMGEHRKDGKVYANTQEVIKFELGDIVASDGNNIKIMKLDEEDFEFEYWLYDIEQIAKQG